MLGFGAEVSYGNFDLQRRTSGSSHSCSQASWDASWHSNVVLWTRVEKMILMMLFNKYRWRKQVLPLLWRSHLLFVDASKAKLKGWTHLKILRHRRLLIFVLSLGTNKPPPPARRDVNKMLMMDCDRRRMRCSPTDLNEAVILELSWAWKPKGSSGLEEDHCFRRVPTLSLFQRLVNLPRRCLLLAICWSF